MSEITNTRCPNAGCSKNLTRGLGMQEWWTGQRGELEGDVIQNNAVENRPRPRRRSIWEPAEWNAFAVRSLACCRAYEAGEICRLN